MCFELLWKKTENEKEETKHKNKTGHPESDKGSHAYNRCQKEYLTLDDLIIDQTIFPPAEMLAYVQPNLIDDLSGKQPFFQPLNENYNSYATTVILEGKVIVYIGEEEQQQLSICQKSLHGYRFSYSCYSSHINDKPHLRTFIRFLQKYYQQRLS